MGGVCVWPPPLTLFCIHIYSLATACPVCYPPRTKQGLRWRCWFSSALPRTPVQESVELLPRTGTTRWESAWPEPGTGVTVSQAGLVRAIGQARPWDGRVAYVTMQTRGGARVG